MADAERNLRVILKYDTDTASVNKASQAAEGLGKHLDKAGKAAKDSAGKIQAIREASSQLQSVGVQVGALGAAITGGLVVAAKGYVAQVSIAEKTSRQWLGATASVEQSYTRLGRVAAQQLLPAYQQMAGLADKAASFVEKNPQTVNTGLMIGGSLVALGGLAAGLGQLGHMLTGLVALKSALGGLSALGGGAAAAAGGEAAGGAAAAAGGAAAGGAASLLPPVLIAAMVAAVGTGVYNALAKTPGGQARNMAAAPGQALTLGATGLGMMFSGGDPKVAAEWGRSIGELTGAIKPAQAATGQLGESFTHTKEELRAYLSFQRAEEQALRSYGIQLQRTNRDFQRQELFAEEDHNKSRSRQLRDFNRQELITERDYYRQRMIAARDFGIQVRRQEQDFQKDARRANEDHQLELFDIIRSGDAMAYFQSQRAYNIQRSRAEEDYAISRSRENEDFGRQIADQAREFAIQRENRLVDFQIRLKDDATDYQIQRKRAKEQFDIQLKDMKQNFDEERRARRQAFIDQEGDLVEGETRRLELLHNFNAAAIQDLETMFAQARNMVDLYAEGTTGSRDVGGYVGSGLYRMHDNEFVLDRETTAQAERAMNGRLSQDKVLAALASSGGSSQRTLVYQDQRRFERGLTAEERFQIRQEFQNVLAEAFS